MQIPEHRLSLDASSEWVADETDAESRESYGLYLRSVEYGVFLNVRSQVAGGHALTPDGLSELLHDQSWASSPFDVWTSTLDELVVVGGTFETEGMGGEVVLEIFATDGKRLANLAGPGQRAIIHALTPSARRLARTLRFE
jgi:hypothetical protein